MQFKIVIAFEAAITDYYDLSNLVFITNFSKCYMFS